MSDDINLPPLPAQQCAQEQDGANKQVLAQIKILASQRAALRL